MDQVKRLVAAGLSLSEAIKHALGIQIGEMAERYDIPRPILSDVINSRRVANERELDALVAELGGTPDQWREMLWLAAKPVPSSPATT